MAQEEKDAKVRRHVKAVHFPPFLAQEVWSQEQWKRLREKWEAFEGPVHNPDHFMLVDKHSQEGEVEVWSVVEFKEGEIYVDIADDYDLADFEHLLPIVEKPDQHKGGKTTGPNKPCACGSGKKSKRCCG